MRYADDAVIMCELKEDAERIYKVLGLRFGKNITYAEAIMELTKIKLYTYENNQMTLSKLTAKQKKILAALSLTEEDLRLILKGKEMISTILTTTH